MNKTSLYEAVLKKLLRESSIPGNLAAVVEKGGGLRKAAIYDRSIFEEWIEGMEGTWDEESAILAARDSVRGYVVISRPRYPCSNSWEVAGIWGPGIGRIVYSVAFALTPNGILMPDRHVVSASAGEAWKKALGKGIVPVNLDDVDHKSCKLNGTHTEDPGDDCPVHGDRASSRPWIDRAYFAGPMWKEYTEILGALVKRNASFVWEKKTEALILRMAEDEASNAIEKSL